MNNLCTKEEFLQGVADAMHKVLGDPKISDDVKKFIKPKRQPSASIIDGVK